MQNLRIKFSALYFVAACMFFFTACKDKQSTPKDVVQEEVIQTKEEKTSTKNDKMTIICFGNSLTAGYGLDENLAWPALLQNRIDSLGLDYKVVNAGLSGETSSGGLNRVDWVLSQGVDVFILELGANDMLRGLDVESTRENLKAIIDKVIAKNKDVQIVIAGMLSPPNMGIEYESTFNSIFMNLAKDYNVGHIPFLLHDVAGVPELNLPDMKHPNEEGQKIVLENVWSSLQPML